ncbi:MAG: HIT domain-containing protein [Geobacteraceae bacterium]|nr:HIT domain-containing protein [Geobacteraceae bacterium]
MKRLWAPWRMEYIRNNKSAGCIFCLGEQHDRDSENLVLYRTSLSFVMLNRYPYSNGHLLVAPCRHISDLNGLSGEEMNDLFGLVRLATNVLGATASPQGFNIGINLGKAAGAGVEEHLHVHIVPRWHGDTNFMSVVADLRVMPENLQASYDALLPGFSAAR